jgi:hypothetical protein
MDDAAHFARYSDEVLQAMVDEVRRLLDVVGYHFSFCPAYLAETPQPCICGMEALIESRQRCQAELDRRHGLQYIDPFTGHWVNTYPKVNDEQ